MKLVSSSISKIIGIAYLKEHNLTKWWYLKKFLYFFIQFKFIYYVYIQIDTHLISSSILTKLYFEVNLYIFN